MYLWTILGLYTLTEHDGLLIECMYIDCFECFVCVNCLNGIFGYFFVLMCAMYDGALMMTMSDFDDFLVNKSFKF